MFQMGAQGVDGFDCLLLVANDFIGLLALCGRVHKLHVKRFMYI